MLFFDVCWYMSCMTISGGRTEQLDIIAGFLPRHWLYEWFSEFHSCETYSVLSRSPSVVKTGLRLQNYCKDRSGTFPVRMVCYDVIVLSWFVFCSELLDEHNPWHCPRCSKNQCASKTMSVWRYPDTLVVQLKRYVTFLCSWCG